MMAWNHIINSFHGGLDVADRDFRLYIKLVRRLVEGLVDRRADRWEQIRQEVEVARCVHSVVEEMSREAVAGLQ
jgi:hypothetical protein